MGAGVQGVNRWGTLGQLGVPHFCHEKTLKMPQSCHNSATIPCYRPTIAKLAITTKECNHD
jgi:hypothetical protein